MDDVSDDVSNPHIYGHVLCLLSFNSKLVYVSGGKNLRIMVLVICFFLLIGYGLGSWFFDFSWYILLKGSDYFDLF